MSIIKLHNISYTYPNGCKGIENIDLEIPRGKKIALLGANGAGKTTLMMLLNGLFKPSEGSLFYDDQPYSYKKKSLSILRQKVGILFCNPDHQLFTPTVFEEISFGPCQILSDKKQIRALVNEYLDKFDLTEMAQKAPHQLSTGQKKRVAMASILITKPEVLVCDEPASSLDPHHAKLIFNHLDALHQNGSTIIISTHDVDHALQWADHVIVMNDGKVTMAGDTYKILSQQENLRAAKLKQPQLLQLCQMLQIECTPPYSVENISQKIKSRYE